MKKFAISFLVLLIFSIWGCRDNINFEYPCTTWAFAKDSIYHEMYFSDSTLILYDSDVNFFGFLSYEIRNNSIYEKKNSLGDNSEIILKDISFNSSGFKAMFSGEVLQFYRIEDYWFTLDDLVIKDSISRNRFNKEFRERKIHFAKEILEVDTLFGGGVFRVSKEANKAITPMK
jgi:hypothetical protein